MVNFLYSLIVLAIITQLSFPVFAQDEQAGPAVPDSELIYSVNRTPERPFDTARSVKVITSEEIWRKNARNLPELLMEEAGVFVQQTNYGGGSPIIRGLMGKEILILIDGVKINNATYRYGPIQYLNTVNLSMIERIEIVMGIESVLSSYALGGVINIITKKGPPHNQAIPVGGSIYSRYSSADQGFVAHGEVYGNNEKYRYFVGGTYGDWDDVTGGGTIDTQKGTGYDEFASTISFDYFHSTDKTIGLDYQITEQNKVPRTDRIVSGANILDNYDPQRLQLFSLSYQDLTDRPWFNFLQLTLSWNRQDEGHQEIRSDNPTNKRMYDDYQTELAFNAEMNSFFGETHRLLYGFDFFSNEVHSRRKDLNLETGVLKTKRGLYTDGSEYQALALYLQDRFNPWTWMTMTTGLRYNSYKIAGEENSSVGELDLDSTGSDFTGSINLVFHASENLNVITNFTRGFRSPNIEDVSVYDEREEGTEVPNPDINSVVIITSEVGVKYTNPFISGSVFYYHSRLTDMMERSSGTYNGLTFFDLNENGIQDDDEPDVLQRQNIGEAEIDGVELDFLVRPHRCFIITGNYVWTKGEDTLNDTPLSRIPPGYGTVALRWSPTRSLKPWAEVVYHFAAAQRDVSPRDESDDRIGPNGTDGFSVFNLRGGFSISENLRMSLAFENIFDEKYKYHSSGMFRPGSQVVLGLELRF